MGSATGFICSVCETRFTVRQGGGFIFDLLHCDACGAAKSVSHKDLGDIHLRFVKGLAPRPYALVRSAMDWRIQAEYQGEPIGRVEYRMLAEGSLGACTCGGRFRYDAPARCPSCRSTSEQWKRNPKAAWMFYD